MQVFKRMYARADPSGDYEAPRLKGDMFLCAPPDVVEAELRAQAHKAGLSMQVTWREVLGSGDAQRIHDYAQLRECRTWETFYPAVRQRTSAWRTYLESMLPPCLCDYSQQASRPRMGEDLFTLLRSTHV